MSSQLSRRALQRGLGSPAVTQSTAARIARRVPPCAAQVGTGRWISSDRNKASKGHERSFKGQMLESITARIAREKEELKIAALEREARKKSDNVPITMRKSKTGPLPLFWLGRTRGNVTALADATSVCFPHLQSSSARAS